MWKNINHLTSDKAKSSIQTIDIPVDENINWNDIKKTKLQFKTIDDPEIMKHVIAERNSRHLNQAQDTPSTIEPLLSLIGTDNFTSFSQELLNRKADVKSLEISPTITKYLKNLKQNKEVISTKTNKFIPLHEYKQGFKKRKELITIFPSGRHLDHHHNLISPDGNQYNEDKEDVSERMWNLHHSITSIALINEKTSLQMAYINSDTNTKRRKKTLNT